MTSDLQHTETAEPTPKKASKQILKSEIVEGMDALEKSTGRLFISGLSAGLDLGFSVLLMGVMWTQAHRWLAEPIVNLLVANMYAVGFIFVVLGRSELFTEQTTLAVLPLLNGKTSVAALLRLWVVVYVANIIGGAIFARLVTTAGPALGDIQLAAFGELAHRVVDHSNGTLFVSALLAGWLMGLLSWLVAAGRDTISQLLIVWIITTSIGFAGLHHVVAGSIEVFCGAFAHQGITIEVIARVLFWTTLGNIVGGTVFVAILKYAHAKPELADEETKNDRLTLFGKVRHP